jgi:flagellar basal-body rod protein FlgC
MDFTNTFAISAAGMSAEKLRLDVIALNLANVHSVKGADGQVFQPLRVMIRPAGPSFAEGFSRSVAGPRFAPPVATVVPTDAPPRLVHEPGHPDADAKGMVAYPGVDHATEMMSLAVALRAYQANVVVMNATKAMALKALEIGAPR